MSTATSPPSATSPRSTAVERAQVREAAYAAFTSGAPRAPGANAAVRALVAGRPVGEPRTAELFTAFTAEYERQVAAALGNLF